MALRASASLLAVSVLTGLLLPTPTSAHDLEIVIESWVRVGRVQSGQVELLLAIKQTNIDWLQQKLWSVSYPDSPGYGQYLNFDEIAEHVHGKPESVLVVLDTFAGVGVGEGNFRFTIGRDFAVVVAPIPAVEELFSAEFFLFEHVEDPDYKIVKSISYKLPQSLLGHVDFVSGISNFPRRNRVSPRRHETFNSTRLGTDPDSIARDYNISYTASNPQTTQAVASFLKQYFSPSDLEKFQDENGIPSQPIAKTEGENDPSNPGIEADLDVEYITAIGRNVTTWFVSVSRTANKGQEDFLYWISQQINDTSSPWVHSVSYGDYEMSIPVDYQNRTDIEFMKFGVSGRTILVASGDEGVHCRKNRYIPEWPTCSPYVTSVGGTTSLSEVWVDGGGGFSDTFPMPDYQKEVVEAYLKSGKAPPTKYFNSSGRAYPDVSAFAVDFAIVFQGEGGAVDGTSCATPTFAGVVSCLNDVRLNNGKSTLGFLNPLLYQTLQGKGFFDITKGSNSGGRSCPGFDAVPGWDPASGWGSPNFGELSELVLKI